MNKLPTFRFIILILHAQQLFHSIMLAYLIIMLTEPFSPQGLVRLWGFPHQSKGLCNLDEVHQLMSYLVCCSGCGKTSCDLWGAIATRMLTN